MKLKCYKFIKSLSSKQVETLILGLSSFYKELFVASITKQLLKKIHHSQAKHLKKVDYFWVDKYNMKTENKLDR